MTDESFLQETDKEILRCLYASLQAFSTSMIENFVHKMSGYSN